MNQELIKRILKEETQLKNNYKKGIDLAVKMLKKTYPFIVGWELADDIERWQYKVYLTLKVDYSKSLKYYGLEPHPRFHKFLDSYITNQEKVSFPYSLMDYEVSNFDNSQYMEISSTLTDIYEMLPKSVQITRDNGEPKELVVDNYIYVK